MERALWYSKQIRITLGGGEKYRNFITTLRDFRDGKISQTDAVSRVQESLSDHDELLRRLSSFLFEEHKISAKTAADYSLQPKQFGDDDDDDDDEHKDSHIRRAADYGSKASASPPITVEANEGSPKGRFSDDEGSQIHQTTDFVNRVREHFRDDNVAYTHFLDIIGRYKEEGSSQVYEEIKRLFKNCPELYIEFTRFEADCYTTVGMKRLPRFREGVKTGGSTDQKHCITQNPYEEMMFKCEEGQMEVDVQLEWLESARLKMEKFHQVVTATDHDIKRYLSPMDLRCIEQLYTCKDEDGGFGLEVINLLREDPMNTSERVLNRLIQKCEEAGELRHRLNRVSAIAYRDCHEKMLQKQQRSAASSSPEMDKEE